MKKSIKKTKEEILGALEDKDIQKCSVCGGGWSGYKGNYDELCSGHYLEIEPTN